MKNCCKEVQKARDMVYRMINKYGSSRIKQSVIVKYYSTLPFLTYINSTYYIEDFQIY